MHSRLADTTGRIPTQIVHGQTQSFDADALYASLEYVAPIRDAADVHDAEVRAEREPKDPWDPWPAQRVGYGGASQRKPPQRVLSRLAAYLDAYAPR